MNIRYFEYIFRFVYVACVFAVCARAHHWILLFAKYIKNTLIIHYHWNEPHYLVTFFNRFSTRFVLLSTWMKIRVVWALDKIRIDCDCKNCFTRQFVPILEIFLVRHHISPVLGQSTHLTQAIRFLSIYENSFYLHQESAVRPSTVFAFGLYRNSRKLRFGGGPMCWCELKCWNASIVSSPKLTILGFCFLFLVSKRNLLLNYPNFCSHGKNHNFGLKSIRK